MNIFSKQILWSAILLRRNYNFMLHLCVSVRSLLLQYSKKLLSLRSHNTATNVDHYLRLNCYIFTIGKTLTEDEHNNPIHALVSLFGIKTWKNGVITSPANLALTISPPSPSFIVATLWSPLWRHTNLNYAQESRWSTSHKFCFVSCLFVCSFLWKFFIV